MLSLESSYVCIVPVWYSPGDVNGMFQASSVCDDGGEVGRSGPVEIVVAFSSYSAADPAVIAADEIIIIIIISNYIKVRPKASGAGLVCRTDQYFQCQILTYTCRIKTVKSVR